MKDSKEKEHRISNLKDMIDTVKDEEEGIKYEDIEEDSELIDYLNENTRDYGDLEIDDEFIYHPDNDDNNAINLEENPIDEDFLIKTPKESENQLNEENLDSDEEFDDDIIVGEISENFDNVINAKIGRTPVLGIVSTVLGLILIVIGAIVYSSRSERIVDNVISGESSFITVIFIVFGLLLLIYGLYKVIGLKNPLENISNSIDSLDNENDIKTEKMEKEDENIIPKSNIPLDKESFKIGEFKFGDLKNTFKKSKSNSKPKTTPQENIDDIPPAREKPAERKGLTTEEIEEIEYEKVKLDNESIDDIFAEVEGIEDIPIISIDSQEENKKE
ncbi:MAG: topoisomerase IV [Methanobrevibacter sp.]|uniref:topoisomerase IV n=1 Tax=uncultured Methanobrevibacter sp. TaxID=253161 RepID=UPI0025CF1A8E|nr:topoisomerase IV [uncultured Methanobrevibacter sp.]MEE1128860.1 topoisomerase IV [Methanobrevibacter sp.]